MTHPNALAAKIAARNLLHERVRHWVPLLQAAFAPFVGTKVQNGTGEICQKVRKTLPELPNTPGFSVWVTADYNLLARFRCCELHSQHHGCGSHQEETSVAIAELERNSGVLTRLSDFKPESYRTNYNLVEILSARQRVKDAKAALSSAEHDLHGFGEYDR